MPREQMAKVEGLDRLQEQLGSKQVDSLNVVVSYEATYALLIHEDLQRKHPNGQAKFLEQPARTMARQLSQIISDAMKAGKPLEEALMMSGLELQKASQLLVPVQTGALRDSAVTRVEKV